MKLLSIVFLFFINVQYCIAQVAIGTNAIDPSAILEVSSNDKGLLFPRMTTILKTNIVTPATGLLVFDTDEGNFSYFNGTSWMPIKYNRTSVVGAIVSYEANNVPNDWLLLDGSSVLVADYPKLAALYTNWVVGSSINLPDYRGLHLRGNGTNANGVSGNNVGDFQDYATKLPNKAFAIAYPGNHAHSGGTVSTSGNHNHSFYDSNSKATPPSRFYYTFGGTLYNRITPTSTNPPLKSKTKYTAYEGSHLHSYTLNSSGGHNHSLNLGAESVSNPNYRTVNWVIKAK